jgi:hypothetical protein
VCHKVVLFYGWHAAALQRLKTLIKDQGVFEGSRRLLTVEGDVCLQFALQYFLSQVLLIVAALSVVFINTLLKVRVPRLTGEWTEGCVCLLALQRCDIRHGVRPLKCPPKVQQRAVSDHISCSLSLSFPPTPAPMCPVDYRSF